MRLSGGWQPSIWERRLTNRGCGWFRDWFWSSRYEAHPCTTLGCVASWLSNSGFRKPILIVYKIFLAVIVLFAITTWIFITSLAIRFNTPTTFDAGTSSSATRLQIRSWAVSVITPSSLIKIPFLRCLWIVHMSNSIHSNVKRWGIRLTRFCKACICF